MAAEREYKYPVWGTQGGGLVREAGGTYIFVEKPNCPGLDVGDEMPEEWGIIPANGLARQDFDRMDRGSSPTPGETLSALFAARATRRI